MKKITKDNLNKFNLYYHNFHDSYIEKINYDIFNSKIEMLIDVCCAGDVILSSNNTYKTNKTKIRLILNDISQCNIKELFSWDYINEAFFQYIKLDNKEFICFASDKKDPLLYVVCDNIEYEDMN